MPSLLLVFEGLDVAERRYLGLYGSSYLPVVLTQSSHLVSLFPFLVLIPSPLVPHLLDFSMQNP